MAVRVKIFGQDYNIAGDKSADEIQKLADYVDNKMRLVAKMTEKNTGGVIPALTALNIAEELFDALDQADRLKADKAKLDKDNKRMVKLLDESKASFIKEKEAFEKLKKEREEEHSQFSDLEKKCTEYENSVFDLQMENIQLKSELEKLNK